MSALESSRSAPTLGHRGTVSHSLVQSGLDEHSMRPSKRLRSNLSHVYVQPEQHRVQGPDEPYVLLSHVQRWWEVRSYTAVLSSDMQAWKGLALHNTV